MLEPIVAEHEILKQLKKSGLIKLSESTSMGHSIPIDKFIIDTAKLHYGTLMYLLNTDPAKIEVKPNESKTWSKIRRYREDITITHFGWEDISDALQNLSLHGDILLTKAYVEKLHFLHEHHKKLTELWGSLCRLTTAALIRRVR